jgi:putative transposase
VLPTKYRKKIFNDGIYAYFKERAREIGEHYPLVKILEQNHDKEHIHMLVSIPPSMRVCDVVRIIKCNLSRDMKKKFPFLKRCYFGTDGIWSDGYFVSTVGINEEQIRKYIDMQGRQDMGQTGYLFGTKKPQA